MSAGVQRVSGSRASCTGYQAELGSQIETRARRIAPRGCTQAGLVPIRHFGNAYGEYFGPTTSTYTGWQQGFDPLLTPGSRNFWKSHDFSDLVDGIDEGDLPTLLPVCQTLAGRARRLGT